jgi:cytochrome c556
MTRFTWLTVGLLGMLWFGGMSTARAQDAQKVGDFMRAKLIQSQKVLEGLVREDYDAIAKHSQEMSLLSQASNWQVLQTPEYRERSTEFRRSVDAMTEAGKNKNLDGAALAYVEVTMKCVTCHKYVRRVKMAKIDAPNAPRVTLDLNLPRK